MQVKEERISRFGIGPRIAAPAVLLTVAAWAAASAWPGLFQIRPLPGVLRAAGGTLIALGLLLWAAGVVTVMRAYNRDELVTTGVFALVRHPVYAGWISLALPGLVLLTGIWPMLATPCIAYAIFRRSIHREDDYLERRFGPAYLEYRRRVNAVVPIPRLRKR